VETFWPTVGTVFWGRDCEDELLLGGGEKRALIWLWKVVLPALSRPRRRTEYSSLEVA